MAIPLTTPVIWVVVLFVGLVVHQGIGFLRDMYDEGDQKPKRIWFVLQSAVIYLSWSVGYVFTSDLRIFGSRYRLSTFGPALRVVFGTMLIVIVGSILFFLKIKFLKIYSIIEITFAIGMGAQTMSNLRDSIQPVQMLSLAASAYLVVRGLDNLKKYLDEPKERS